MDEYISNLISSNNFVGGGRLQPGPMEVSLHGTIRPNMAPGPSYSQTPAPSFQSQSARPIPNVAGQGMFESEASLSILRADMSHMIAWLRSQNQQNFGFSQSQAFESQASGLSGNAVQDLDFDTATRPSTIPKPYIQLDSRDCAGVVGSAIRSVLLHTCNDQFRQDCFAKLGVSSSGEAGRKIRSRLLEIIHEEEQNRSNDNNNSDTDSEESANGN